MKIQTLTTIVLLGGGSIGCSAADDSATPSPSGPTGTGNWEAPVRPGTPLWHTLDSPAKLAVSQIPTVEAQRLTTAALVEACMSYPRLGFYGVFDDPDAALIGITREFNGFTELKARNDAGDRLVDYYSRCRHEMRAGRTLNLRALDFLNRYLRLPEGRALLSPDNKGLLALEVLRFMHDCRGITGRFSSTEAAAGQLIGGLLVLDEVRTIGNGSTVDSGLVPPEVRESIRRGQGRVTEEFCDELVRVAGRMKR